MEKQFTADRLSMKYRVIYGELVLDEIWVSQDCSELESHSVVSKSLESQAKMIFAESTCKRTDKQPEQIKQMQQAFNVPPQNITNNSLNNCAVCGATLKHVPAGVSKKTGKAYNAFVSCPNGCNRK